MSAVALAEVAASQLGGLVHKPVIKRGLCCPGARYAGQTIDIAANLARSAKPDYLKARALPALNPATA